MVGTFKYEMLSLYENFKSTNFDLPMHWINQRNNEMNLGTFSHWHEELEVSFTIEGSIDEFRINNDKFHTTTGDVLIVAPGDIHSIKKLTPKNHNEIFTLFFDTEALLNDIPNLKQLKFHTYTNVKNPVEAKNLAMDLLKLRDYLNETDKIDQNKLVLKHMMYDVLFRVVYFFGYTDHSTEGQLENLERVPEFVREIIEYIKTHIREDVRVQDLANEFNISPSYLTRSFKRYLNQPPSDYIQMLRLTIAKQKLLNTQYSIQYISDTSGFSSLRTFERVFKNYYHKTPSEYRHSFKNNY